LFGEEKLNKDKLSERELSPGNRPSPQASHQAERFRAPDRARQTIERLRSTIPDDLLAAALALLAELPDPDQGVNLLERLVSSGGEQIIKLLNKNRILLHHVLLIFGHSYWLGETMCQHPDILRTLEREKHLERSFGQEDYRENFGRFRSRSVKTDLAVLLGRFKKRE
jgi:glutamine synthetase adenylyltransferase